MIRSLSLVTLALALTSLSAVGCSGGGPGTGGAGGNGTGPVGGGTACQGQGIKVLAKCNAPKGTYVPVEGADRDAIANELWTLMTNAQCWYKDGSTQQYVFYGSLQYTFWGAVADSKSGGTLSVESIGRYEDKNAAIVYIRSERWLIVGLDSQTLTLGKEMNGGPYIELYKAHNEGRCT